MIVPTKHILPYLIKSSKKITPMLSPLFRPENNGSLKEKLITYVPPVLSSLISSTYLRYY